jgi:hypothetical protein
LPPPNPKKRAVSTAQHQENNEVSKINRKMSSKKEDNNYSNDAILIEPDYNSIVLSKEQE